MEFRRWVIFIKIVLQAAKKLKKIAINCNDEKDCGNGNILW